MEHTRRRRCLGHEAVEHTRQRQWNTHGQGTALASAKAAATQGKGGVLASAKAAATQGKGSVFTAIRELRGQDEGRSVLQPVAFKRLIVAVQDLALFSSQGKAVEGKSPHGKRTCRVVVRATKEMMRKVYGQG